MALRDIDPGLAEQSELELGPGAKRGQWVLPPANILTPAALTLRHAPIADCARYDNLRRTI